MMNDKMITAFTEPVREFDQSVTTKKTMALSFTSNILRITGVFSLAHGRCVYCDVHLLYKRHFLDGFRLRLSDLMEPNTLLPKSLSDLERWRGIRGGGDGENEGEERGDREWQLPSRLWERERLKRLAVEERCLSSSLARSRRTPSFLPIPIPL